MRFPEEVLRSLVFFGTLEKGGGHIEQWKYRGTGFLVAVATGYRDFSATYLVTARHVVAKMEGSDFIIRANRVKEGSISIQGKGAEWTYHPDETSYVDIAVTPFGVLGPELDLRAIPLEMFADTSLLKSERIGIGCEVFVSGLFSHHHGEERNAPIVRSGTIAMFPDDKVTTKYGKMDGYLVESRSIGGLSGSPIYASEFQARTKGAEISLGYQFHLMGLVHGHWDLPPEATVDVEDVDPDYAKKRDGVNMGIAIIVPAFKIVETLNSPHLVERREKAVSDLKTKHSAKEDGAK